MERCGDLPCGACCGWSSGSSASPGCKPHPFKWDRSNWSGTSISTSANTYIHAYTDVCTHIHAYTHTRTHTYMYAHTHIHAYIHACTHIHTHTYIIKLRLRVSKFCTVFLGDPIFTETELGYLQHQIFWEGTEAHSPEVEGERNAECASPSPSL